MPFFPWFSDPTQLATIAFRLGLSFILAVFIGLERELSNQSAGLRTHILISVGSTVFMLLSVTIPEMFFGRFQTDPTRIAAQIVTGIGFLGAGAILKIGINVKGLTTAANMWVTCAIGMAAGAGRYATAILLTAFTLITLTILSYIEKAAIKNRQKKRITLSFINEAPAIETISAIIAGYGLEIKNCDLFEDLTDHVIKIIMDTHFKGNLDLYALSADLKKLPNITALDIIKEEYPFN